MDKNEVRRSRTIWYFATIVVVVVGSFAWKMMDKDHRDVGAEVAQFKMAPEELVMVMSSGDSTAAPYLNAVVELFGVVVENDEKRLVLEGGVIAAWDTTREHRSPKVGELLRIKGRVTGYDDLFEEVRMDGGVLVTAQP